MANPIRSEQHPGSRRWAALEDDGLSAWLYLTEPDVPKPVADCWIYNRVRPIEPAQVEEFRGSAPPVARGVAAEECVLSAPDEAAVRFVWSTDGRSVGLLIGDVPFGFIVGPGNRGHSKYLICESPWGKPWDQASFERLFGAGPTY